MSFWQIIFQKLKAQNCFKNFISRTYFRFWTESWLCSESKIILPTYTMVPRRYVQYNLCATSVTFAWNVWFGLEFAQAIKFLARHNTWDDRTRFVRWSNKPRVLVHLEKLETKLAFQQLDASVHKAKIVSKFFKEEELNWSPDLNRIENSWETVKQELRKQRAL